VEFIQPYRYATQYFSQKFLYSGKIETHFGQKLSAYFVSLSLFCATGLVRRGGSKEM
jgi:hypothetical protein